MLNAIVIDPAAKTIERVNVDDDVNGIQKAMGGVYFEPIYMYSYTQREDWKSHILLVDEEARMLEKEPPMFGLDGVGLFLGKALIVKGTGENFIDPTLDFDDLKIDIHFPD